MDVVCPRDRAPLEREADSLACSNGHVYPVVDGIPVLLVGEEEPTHASCWVSLERRDRDGAGGEGEIEPLVQEVIAATCGNLYKHLIGTMDTYPIPVIRLPPGEGRAFLEVGCNWGRWCVSASRRGYRATGVDPSLDAIRAAVGVAEQLEADAEYVVGDARHLPFPEASFDVVFSYSVFQHFTREDALASFAELGRTLKPGGLALVQMANVWGVRSLFNQLRERRFREPRTMFDVRYWSPRELEDAFTHAVGPTSLSVDGFLTLNPQPADLPLLPRRYRALVRGSEALRRLSGRLPFLVNAADSVYVAARK
ncbi:MAG: methyltransferase domain-containing protein [Actinomycetota bacterium]|nr:methyltransferase domain-containing protein [Actinomycetota bacterium]